jgi:alginate O-acetyltransferase complex protein AlgJ
MTEFGVNKDISPGQGRSGEHRGPPVWKLATVVLFFILALFPSIMFIAGYISPQIIPEIKLNELRTLAVFPQPSLSTWRDLPVQMDAWWSDHFGFRSGLVRLNNALNIKLTGVSPVNLVVIGKEGWLFYTGDDALLDYQGLFPLTDEALNKITANLEARRSWLETQGCQYLIVVAPNKQTIYGQYLPDWTNHRVGPTRLDQVENALGPDSRINLLDLRTTFISKSGSFHTPDGVPIPFYYKTDTHWNDLGASLAYQAILERLHVEMTGPPNPIDYGLSPVVTPRPGGDLAAMLGMTDQFSDREVTIDPEYFQFGPKNHIKVLIFWDSFYVALKPFLTGGFDEAIESPERSRPFDYALVEKEKPVLVIDLFTERFLMQRLSPPPAP